MVGRPVQGAGLGLTLAFAPTRDLLTGRHGVIELHQKLGFVTRWDPVLLVRQKF